MATAHEIAVITNSCVKTPVDPKSGALRTVNERGDATLSSTWQGKRGEYENKENRTPFEEIGPDLGTLSDAEFYERLVALKAEHRKTLELCETLYNDKLSKLRSTSQVVQNPKSNVSTVSVSKDFSMTPSRSVDFGKNATESRKTGSKYSKPPSGRPKSAEPPTMSRSLTNKSPWRTAAGSPFSSQDEDLFRAGLRRSNDLEEFLSGDEQDYLNDSKHSKISEMWENFSVDDYAPPSKPRPRSASMSKLMSSRENDMVAKRPKKKEWRHQITIPKPFDMTLRESNKTPRKTKAMIELDEEREYRERENEAECEKKFKAKPVPAHVYMPLYDEIMEEKESKRRLVKEHSKEVMKSQEKPFTFMKREEEKKRQNKTKSRSMAEYDNQQKKEFQAHPFPSHIFDDSVTDRVKEEEEYRRLRMQIRSEKLLKTSSLPPNMASRGQDYVDGKSRQKLYADRAKKAGFTPEHKFKPNINKDMPDFDDLHRQYMKEVAQRKAMKEATVCKPFNIRTVKKESKGYDEFDRTDDFSRANGTIHHAVYSTSKVKTIYQIILLCIIVVFTIIIYWY